MADKQGLDFSRISREFRNLVSRRRELMIFLGSMFAAMGIMLVNVLEGKLPEALAPLEKNAFLYYSIILLFPTLIIALRVMRLEGGMVINGVFYSRMLKEELHPQIDPAGSARLNWLGVSTQFFLLTDIICSFSVALLGIALHLHWALVVLMSGLVFLCLLGLFLRNHLKAGQFALARIESVQIESFTREDEEDHLSGSLEDANHDMITVISFVGLLLFSVFESLSGLGGIQAGTELEAVDVEAAGSVVYPLFLLLGTASAMVIYMRLRRAVGKFSLDLDPTDRPFTPWKMTDSALGYALLSVFLVIAVHLLIYAVMGALGGTLWIIDVVVFVLALLEYQWSLVRERKRQNRTPEATQEKKA